MEKIFVSLAVALCCFFVIGYTNSLPADNILVQNALKEDSHSIYQCPDPTNITTPPLCSTHIKENGKFWQTIKKTINCPESGINKIKIGCIIVRDNMDNDEGGYATITDGGLNDYAVTVHLRSQSSKGLDYTVTVYTVNATKVDML